MREVRNVLLYRCSDLPQTALPTPVTDVRRSGFAMRSSEVFFMKNILIAATLAASVLLGGCAGSSIYRGMDAASGAFVSTHSPVVSVKAAEGYESVLSGYTMCRVSFEDSMMGSSLADVWASLQDREGAQLVTVLAECGSDKIWEVRPIGVDFQRLKVFYEKNGVAPDDATVHVYVRPASMDPWSQLFASAGRTQWEGSTLVARYEWTNTTQRDKLIVEYREPAPEFFDGMNPRLSDVTAFIERSQKAFTLGGVSMPATPVSADRLAVSDMLLSPVLGSVTMNGFLLF